MTSLSTSFTQPSWQLKALDESLDNLVLTVEDSLSIGRGKENHVVLGSKQVSRNHAKLEVVDGKLQVTDLGSSNGTYINDEKIAPNSTQLLGEGDVVSFAVFKFQVNEPMQDQHNVDTNVPVTPKSSTPATPSVTETAPSTSLNNLNNLNNKDAIDTSADAIDTSADTKLNTNTDVETTGTEATLKATVRENKAHEAKVQEAYHSNEPEELNTMNQSELNDKLEQELEEPISIGDPNQEENHIDHPAATDDDQKTFKDGLNKVDATPQTEPNEHFESLANQADEEVLEAKQAAAAKFSGTTDLNTQNHHETSAQTAHKEPDTTSLDTSIDSNTIGETPQHDVANVNQTQPAHSTASGGGGKGILWLIIILVILAILVWFLSSGRM